MIYEEAWPGARRPEFRWTHLSICKSKGLQWDRNKAPFQFLLWYRNCTLVKSQVSWGLLSPPHSCPEQRRRWTLRGSFEFWSH
jgi:hypothetical protein